MIPFDGEAFENEVDRLYEEAVEEYIETYNTEEAFEEMLNDCYGPVEVRGITFSPGQILRELDPTAFRCGLADYEDEVRDRATDEIDRSGYFDEALENLDMEEEL